LFPNARTQNTPPLPLAEGHAPTKKNAVPIRMAAMLTGGFARNVDGGPFGPAFSPGLSGQWVDVALSANRV